VANLLLRLGTRERFNIDLRVKGATSTVLLSQRRDRCINKTVASLSARVGNPRPPQD
jgi:hypothetical protein